MLPTRAAILLALLGLALWLPLLVFALVPGLAPEVVDDALLTNVGWLILGFDVGVLGLVWGDAILAWRQSRASRLTVRRDPPARLSLGVGNEVTLILENRNRLALRLVVRDLPPITFHSSANLIAVRVPGRGTLRVTYTLTPDERGNFNFGDLHVRCQGPLGLGAIDRVIPAAQPVQVYPNLLEVRRYEALVRSSLMLAGGYRTRRLPGAGREFSHYRDYTPDDDYRQVSWKATARRNRPITSVYESEHSQDILFCLDAGRMMATRVGALSKLDHAINAVLMLAHVSQTFQDNLGLLVFSHTVHLYLPPSKGRGQQARFLQALYSIKAQLSHVDYREAFSHLITRHPKRALTMIFTDLLDSETSRDYLESVLLLKRFHLPLTLAVADVPLQNLAATEPSSVGEMYDVLVARDLLHGRGEMLRQLERQGVPVLDTVPERLTVDAVNRYLSLKTGVKM